MVRELPSVYDQPVVRVIFGARHVTSYAAFGLLARNRQRNTLLSKVQMPRCLGGNAERIEDTYTEGTERGTSLSP